ncbi:hypothetical protein EH68_01465 [Enterococcus gallinarum]|nr:hypothetical protein [Enterococcus gallinarum]KIL83031.1 hypothetical protein EH68_01465 [Enterococcus gallinarum]
MSEPFIKKLIPAIATMPEHLYGGIDGRKRLAREIGGSLADSDPSEAEEQIRISYDSLLIGTSLRPLVDKKTWDDSVREAYIKEVNRRKARNECE